MLFSAGLVKPFPYAGDYSTNLYNPTRIHVARNRRAISCLDIVDIFRVVLVKLSLLIVLVVIEYVVLTYIPTTDPNSQLSPRPDTKRDPDPPAANLFNHPGYPR